MWPSFTIEVRLCILCLECTQTQTLAIGLNPSLLFRRCQAGAGAGGACARACGRARREGEDRSQVHTSRGTAVAGFRVGT